jgi:hypothetical protein
VDHGYGRRCFQPLVWHALQCARHIAEQARVNLCVLVPDDTDAASCREETVVAFERIAEAVGRGMERSQAIYRFLDMPEVVRQYFMHKNAFHTRAMSVRGGSACA